MVHGDMTALFARPLLGMCRCSAIGLFPIFEPFEVADAGIGFLCVAVYAGLEFFSPPSSVLYLPCAATQVSSSLSYV